MKWNLKRELFPLVLCMIFIILSVYFYSRLPEVIPSHFNSQGNANGYAPKDLFMVGMFGVIVGVYLLLTFIPFIDPLWKKIEHRYTVVLFMRDLVIGFLVFVYLLCLNAAKTGILEVRSLSVGFGLFFILLGNYLPRVPQNWFIGIRSPWTMSSEVVWKKTHILGGWLFILMGLVLIILTLMGVDFIYTLVLLIPVVIYVAILYPFFLYKKLQKGNIIL